MSNKPPGVKIDGIRGSIPAGYLLGRVDPGHGPVQLISQAKAQSAGLIPASLPGPPTGAAGGDLSGTYPNPSVVALRGNAVAVTAPDTLDVLAWSGTAWAPLDLATVAYSGNYTDLIGLPAIHNVPAGGTAGQALTKVDGTDYNLAWTTISAGSGGGAASIYDDGTNLYIAVSDADGQLVLDGSGDPVFVQEVLPKSALPSQPNYAEYTTVGAQTITTPVDPVTGKLAVRLEVTFKAGGGGGAGGGSGGTAGADGATTAFDTAGLNVVANAGKGGPLSGSGGLGGSAGTGTATYRTPGMAGGNVAEVFNTTTTGGVIGGTGGGVGGGQGGAASGGARAGTAGSNGGGGGGGNVAIDVIANVWADAWGAGGGEAETVFLVIDNPAASYLASIGDGGTAGAAGTGGGAGAKGGKGFIRVKAIF